MISNKTNSETRMGWVNALPSLVIPLCVGMSMYLLIGAAFQQGMVSNETLVRYLTGHPISKITLAMFCVGMAALLMIADNVFHQFRRFQDIRLRLQDDSSVSGPLQGAAGSTLESVTNGGTTLKGPEVNDSTEPVLQTGVSTEIEATRSGPNHGSQLLDPQERSQRFLEWLQQYPHSVRQHYLWRRLNTAMQYVARTGSAAGVEEELKYHSDIELERQQQRYSLVRILVWATPMLGFLGTVLGISQALGGIQVGPENDFQQMMGGLRASLYVAFDTTALALTLSIVLMFCQFLVDRFEIQLLQHVDESANQQVAEHFAGDAQTDPRANALERIGRTILATTHELVQRQSELWQSSIRSAERVWQESVSAANRAAGEHLRNSLGEAVLELGSTIDGSIERADHSMGKRWEQWQVTLSENARSILTGQQEIQKQSQLLEAVLKQIINVEEIQGSVNRNLDALAMTSRMHQTLEQLAAAVSGLNQPDNSGRSLNEVQSSEVSDEPFSAEVMGPAKLKIFRGAANPDLTTGSSARSTNSPVQNPVRRAA